MCVGFISPGDVAQAIASHLPALQQLASEAVTALPETAAVKRGRSRIGQRP